jgi:surface protein
MKRKAKRIMTLVLAIVMTLSALGISPALALAEETAVCLYESAETEFSFELPGLGMEVKQDVELEFIAVEELSTEVAAFAASGCPHCSGCFLMDANTIGMGGALWLLYSCGTVAVRAGYINWTGGFPGWISPWDGHNHSIRRIIFTGPVTTGTSLRALFSCMFSLESIEGLNFINTSNVEDMSIMFLRTYSLQSVDLSGWNTGNVISMSDMFDRATALTNIVGISNFNTGSLRHASGMFRHTRSLPTLDLSNWNTTNLEDASSMFLDTSSLTSLNISTWDTPNLTWMGSMFFNASSLTSLDLSNWTINTGNMLWGWNMADMFTGMTSLNRLVLGSNFRFFNSPLPNLPHVPTNASFTGRWWNEGSGVVHVLTSNQLMAQYNSTMAGTWVWQPVCHCVHCLTCGCGIAHRGTVTHPRSTPGPNDAPWRFYGCGTVVVDAGYIVWDGLHSWGASPWSSLWVWNHPPVQRIYFTGPITAGSSLRGLFAELHELVSIEGLERIDTRNVVTMQFMFRDAFNLANVGGSASGLTRWDTSNVTDMLGMFSRAFSTPNSLDTLHLQNWNTRNVTDMTEMFIGASNLRRINMSGWDTRQVTAMWNKFAGATGIRELTLSANCRFPGPTAIGLMPNPPFTGRWRNVGSGTVTNPAGAHILTSLQLMQFYNTTPITDTWVWLP